MRITTIATQKGGVGKTTTALSLAEQLTRKGLSVLLIDCDQQQNASQNMRADLDRGGIYEIMTGEKKAAGLIQRTERGDIIPATDSLIGADGQFAGKLDTLAKVIRPIRNDYDHIIVDTPPSICAITLTAITASTDIIIPLEAAFFSVQGLEQLIYYLDQIRNSTEYDPQIAGLLFTKYNKRETLAQQYREALDQRANDLGLHVYRTEIRSSAAVKKAQALGEGLFSFDPRSTSALDYADFVEEYLAQIGRAHV